MVALQGLVRRVISQSMRSGARRRGAPGRGVPGGAPGRGPVGGGRQARQDAMIGRQVRKFLKR